MCPSRPRPPQPDAVTAEVLAEVERVFGAVELVEVRWLSSPQRELQEPEADGLGEDGPR